MRFEEARVGRDIDRIDFTREERARYRDKVKSCLAALRQLVDEDRFETGRHRIGVEMEVYLTDADGQPMPINAEVLERIASDDFSTELAQFNIEFDVSPRRLSGDALRTVEDELRASLEQANEKAEELGAQIVIIGILPTLSDLDITESNLSANPRYRALNDSILAARGEDITIRIEGQDTLAMTSSSILLEAACTSMQLHLQVDPSDFATAWNAAQALSAPLVAVAANSPFLLGRRLHHETRIALFEQAIDTRTEEHANQGVRPRVWFGEAWLREGIFELFDENVRYFPALLPVIEDEDPHEVLARGDVPQLAEMTLHNGTIYRWNRPIYEVAHGRPHLRIENRVLPAGPTAIDSTANTAFYYGLLAGLVDERQPVWESMSFEAAADNFFAAARDGLGARLFWPKVGARIPADELIQRHLLDLARAGLERWGVDDADIERYLDVISERARTGRNGARWQLDCYAHLIDVEEATPDEARSEVVRRYHERSRKGEPVHTWDLEG